MKIGRLVFGFLTIVILGGLIGVLILGVSRIPSADAQLAPSAQPLRVLLTRPQDGDNYPAGAGLVVRVETIAVEPITKIELWANGVLARSELPGKLDQQYSVKFFEWQVPTPGNYALVARALDKRGRAAYSNTINITSVASKGSRALYTAKPGDTLDSIAKQYGVATNKIQVVGATTHALTPGAQVFVDLPAPPPSPADTNLPAPPPANTDAPSSDSMSGVSVWFDQNVVAKFNPPQIPSAPSLSYSIAECQPQLYIADTSSNEHGFFIYRSQAGQTTFDRIATLGAHNGAQPIKYTDQSQLGTVQYYVSAFNGGGESASNVTQVAPDAKSCAPALIDDVALNDLVPFDPQTIDALYLYLRSGNGEWQRVPSDSDTFISPRQDALTLAGLIPFKLTKESSSIQGEVWGWKKGTLALLGAFDQTIPSGAALQARKSTKTTLEVCTIDTGACAWGKVWGMSSWVSKEFKWSTAVEMDGGLWQVAAQPFGADASLNPAGLLLTGSTEKSVHFSIDFGLLAPEPLQIGNQPPIQVNPNAQLPNVGASQSQKSNPSIPFDLSLVLAGGQSPSGSSQSIAQFNPAALNMPDLPLATYYVRIIPTKGGQVSSSPSNTVIINIVKPSSPNIEIPVMPPEFQTPLYTVEILKYAPPVFEDPNLWGCITIVGYTKDVAPGVPIWTKGNYCPKSWQGDNNQGFDAFWEDLTGGAKTVLNWASKTWNELKDFAADLLLKYTPLGWQCQLAEDVAMPEGTCEKMMHAAVDAGLVAMGIPPSIPNFDQLLDEGLDYAAELAVQEALKQVPACAGTPCEDEIRKNIKNTLKQAADQALSNNSLAQGCAGEAEAHKHGVEPLCPPKGHIVRPLPGAVYQPPTMQLRITRIKNVPDPNPLPSCTLGVGMNTTFHFNGGQVGGPYVDSPTMDAPPQDASGTPFVGVSLPIPKLKPGESKQVALAFNAWNVPYVFPWHKAYSQFYHTVLPEDFKIRDWYQLVQEGKTTLHAGASFNGIPGYVAGQASPCAVSTTFQVK